MDRGKTDIVVFMAATHFIGKHEQEDPAPIIAYDWFVCTKTKK